MCGLFCCKQKTAYEMRISDWSSDVCSSDLIARFRLARGDQGGAGIAAGRAVRINPRNVDAIIFRGTLIRDQYGLRAALPWFRKALAIDRNNVPALGEYAATLGEIGRTRQMLALTRKMIALDPGKDRKSTRLNSSH